MPKENCFCLFSLCRCFVCLFMIFSLGVIIQLNKALRLGTIIVLCASCTFENVDRKFWQNMKKLPQFHRESFYRKIPMFCVVFLSSPIWKIYVPVTSAKSHRQLTDVVGCLKIFFSSVRVGWSVLSACEKTQEWN